MSLRTVVLPFTVLIAAVAGCYTGSAVDANRAPTAEVDGAQPDARDGGPATPAAATGIPCDVAALLKTECATCHGETLSGGAPNRLVSYDDLAAISESDPSSTVAALSLARMRSTRRPMPPERQLGEGAIDAFAKWVTAGLPRGSCNGPGGQGGTDPTDAGPSHPESVCTNNMTTDPLGPSGPTMRPGEACLSCHAEGKPDTFYKFQIAGTVYPTLHEPNYCNGDGDTKVQIIDSRGTTRELRTSETGNFYLRVGLPIVPPFTVQVIRGHKIRTMQRELTSLENGDGDCNHCHTESGANGAPGRVVSP